MAIIAFIPSQQTNQPNNKDRWASYQMAHESISVDISVGRISIFQAYSVQFRSIGELDDRKIFRRRALVTS